MIPVKQTVLSDRKNGIFGNCLRACLASILEVDIDSIPAFEVKYAIKGPDWFYDYIAYLKTQGLVDKGIIGSKADPVTQEELDSYAGLDGYYIVGGESPRKHVTNGHAVIYYQGRECFDPHPDNTFLTKTWYIMDIKKIVDDPNSK